MNDQGNTLAASLAAGLCGAAALTAVHQLATRITDDAPRMDVVGERAIVKGLEATGTTPPQEPALHRWALAGDILANSAYYSLVGSGSPTQVWRRGVALGLAAGAGALVLPRPMGLGDPPRSDRLANQIMTVSWYLLGGIVAAAVASRGAGSAGRRARGRFTPGARHRWGDVTMSDDTRDRSREPNPVVPETESGTTSEEDFGKSDRYANKDEGKDFNFRTTGDGTSWDSGRDASVTDGTRLETETRAADAENPGVPTKPADKS